MNLKLDRKFPSVSDMEIAARKKLPKFVWDYLYCGMGSGGSVRRNRQALDQIEFIPDYIVDADSVDLSTSFLGQDYAMPFGVAPVGLGGLTWPKSAETIATATRQYEIPFCTSTFAMADIESISQIADDFAWFQLYLPRDESIEDDLLLRAKTACYQNLIITVDVPHAMRRDHDIRNGFSIPLKINLKNVLQIASHPHWAVSMLKQGFPTFENLTRYVPENYSKNDALAYLGNLTTGHITPTILSRLRDKWKGNLIVKGILNSEDALCCQKTGADAIIVSNHGGRQLEAAPSPVQTLKSIRSEVGEAFPIIADGGIRTGLDICRMLAVGADFVMLGRAFYYAVAAMGESGPAHLIEILKEELRGTLSQLGLTNARHIQSRLDKDYTST